MSIQQESRYRLRHIRNVTAVVRAIALVALLLLSFSLKAQNDADFPPRPQPPRLVNDLANVLSPSEEADLEKKLVDFDNSTSTQITVVTITSIGSYDIADYATTLGERWGVGRKGKDNGAVLLAAMNERKLNISTGYGLEGALPDALAGRIIRNEIAPSFKQGRYGEGLNKGVDAIMLATKGEYTNDEKSGGGHKLSFWQIVVIVVVIYLVLWFLSKIGGGGGGGGRYMSGRGFGGFGGGFIGGFGSGSSWGGGGSSGGSGGFGGFGGGSFGGGGASGDW